jgi:hypothetical protein
MGKEQQEVVVAYFKILSQHLRGETAGNIEMFKTDGL